ncbi:MAG: hypothetical protein FDX30_09055 [Chlorobium sp.]|nr:MAG: hypothetical protein FDX30_09055 [Chlorobium sp.]
MIVEAFLSCDGANDSRGKLNILGTFNSINSEVIPVALPCFYIIGIIRYKKNEIGIHKVDVKIMQNNNVIFSALEGQEIEFNDFDGNDTFNMNIIVNVIGCEFKNYGEYYINLQIDGILLAKSTLYIKP